MVDAGHVDAVGAVRLGAIADAGPTAQSIPKPSDTQAEPWEYSLTVDGYIIEGSDGYASPTFTADHNWLHLEARYNYENFRTGSLWAGYNFSWGKTWQFAVTPMIGGVFGRTNGIAPGCEASLAYKKLTFSIDNEYVFDTTSKSGNFYYTWPQLTYQPLDWLKLGVVAQRTTVISDTSWMSSAASSLGSSTRSLNSPPTSSTPEPAAHRWYWK